MRVGLAFALGSFVVGTFAGDVAFAQQPPPGTQGIAKPAHLPPPVTAAPFSAERRQVRNRTLGDGTHITETWPVQKIFRDAQGRMRTERALLTTPNAPEFPRVVEIDDAAGGTRIILEPVRKRAHRFSMISTETPEPGTKDAEDLGAWVIQGLRAEGQRRKLKIPAAEHEEMPVTVTVETWTAPDLQFVVRQKIADPREGETVEELGRIQTGEQSASLFTIPPDYEVIEEAGDFEIAYTARSHASLPTILARYPAVYTEVARRGGVQGTVQLTLFVDESGHAQGIHVERSLEPGLDLEAIKAVRRWRFHPGEQDGRAVRVPVRVEVTFSLNN